jgi:lipopolysaccharide transport system permease protein
MLKSTMATDVSARSEIAPESQEITVSPETVVRPTRGRPSLNLRELWNYRELFYFLTWRDIKVRYKQTGLGVAWAVLQPLSTVIVFTIFFNRVANISSGDIPYPVFVLAGLVPWTFFANALTTSSGSVVASANILTKVYFPRLVIPSATALAGLPDFLISFVLLILIMALYGVAPSLLVVFLPLILLLVFAAALGAGLWLAALNVEYRDVRYIVPVGVQLWLLASPVAYPADDLASPWNVVYGINPMAGAIESFRWAVLGTPAPALGMVALSTLVTVVLLGSGAYYFRAMERRFADTI